MATVNKENADPTEINLTTLFREGQTNLEAKRCDNLFQELDSRSLTEEEEQIIQKRVEFQRKMFEQYEKREKKRKVEELMEMCPDLTEDEAERALEMCDNREEEAASQLTSDPGFLRRVKAGSAPAVERKSSGTSSGTWCAKPSGARPKKVDLSKLGDGVFVGSFRGKGFEAKKVVGGGGGGGLAAAPKPRARAKEAAPAEVDGGDVVGDEAQQQLVAEDDDDDVNEAPPTSVPKGRRSSLRRARSGDALPAAPPLQPSPTAASPQQQQQDEPSARSPTPQEGEDAAVSSPAPRTAAGAAAAAKTPAQAGGAAGKQAGGEGSEEGSRATYLLVREVANGAVRPVTDSEVKAIGSRPRISSDDDGEGEEGGGRAAVLPKATGVKRTVAMATAKTLLKQTVDRAVAMLRKLNQEAALFALGAAEDIDAGAAAALRAAFEQQDPVAAVAAADDAFVEQPGAAAAVAPVEAKEEERWPGEDEGKGQVAEQGAKAKVVQQGQQGGRGRGQQQRTGDDDDEETDTDSEFAAPPPAAKQSKGRGGRFVRGGKAERSRAGDAAVKAKPRGRKQQQKKGAAEEGTAGGDAAIEKGGDAGDDVALKVEGGQQQQAQAMELDAAEQQQGSQDSGGPKRKAPDAAAGGGEEQAEEQQGQPSSEAKQQQEEEDGATAPAAKRAKAPSGGGGRGGGGRGRGARAISRTGHTSRGRVRQKSSKLAQMVEVGTLVDKPGWHNAGYIFPAGFVSRIVFRSSVEINQLTVHECSIIGRGGKFWPKPTFQVTAMDRKEEPLVAASCTGCWTAILKRINGEIEGRRKAGEDLPPPPKTAIAGPEYFGLNNPEVMEAVEALDPDHLCADYWQGKADREAAAQGLGPAAAPREKKATRQPRAQGGGGGRRGKKRYEESDDDDMGGDDDEDDMEATYKRRNWSGVSRTDRYRKRRADAGEEEEVDEENPLADFLDPITLEPVVAPAISPYGHVMGWATWKAVLDENEQCPFTKQPLKVQQLKRLTLTNIDSYRDSIVNK